MTPQKARKLNEICRLKCDNISAGDYWILLGVGDVTLAHQREGENAETMLTIPRAQFDKLVGWYIRDQKSPPASREEQKGEG